MFGKKKSNNEGPQKKDFQQVDDKKSLKQIDKIIDRLDGDEKVLEVATQSRVKPGGSVITTPNTVYATNKRLIIRTTTLLGARQNVEDYQYDNLTSITLEKGVFTSTLVLTAPGMGTASRPGLSSGLLAWGRGEDGMIDAIPKDKAEKILNIVRNAIVEAKKRSETPQQVVQQASIADELAKIAKLKEQGILSEEEFTKMKQDLISKM